MADKIIITIMSSNREVSENLRKACRDTWLSNKQKNIEYLFFVGRGYEGNESDVVELDVQDGYWDLPQKSLHMFRHVSNMDFDYVFKCDDDTYIRLERLHELCDGHDFVGSKSLDNKHNKFASGGAGYLLSKNIINKVISEDIPLKGAEDVIFSKLGMKYADKWRSDNGLNPGKHIGNNITCHWMNVDDMMTTHIITYDEDDNFLFYKIKHPGWEDTVKLHKKTNIFKRLKHVDGGVAEFLDDTLILNWNSWKPEKFIKDGEIWKLKK